MLDEFIEYLKNQIGEPYLWGGQHTELTQENYVEVINRKEHKADGSDRGKYKDGTTYAEAAIEFCEKKFDEGAEVLFAYDCSGLGMWFLEDYKHIYSHDMSANTMLSVCVDLTYDEPPEKGWWCFKLNDSGEATHIGYMVDNETLIEAKGRKYGVVKTKWRDDAWDIWGIPKCFYDEIVNPEPQPEPPVPPEPETKVEVIAKSVRVRHGNNVLSKTILIAHNKAWYKAHGISHGNDKFNLIDIADNGWYQIETKAGLGYITNKPKYTQLIEA